MPENVAKTEKHNFKQWSDVDGQIICVSNTMKKLERGYYRLGVNRTLGLYFQKAEINLNNLIRLPNKVTSDLIKDINKFWNSREVYEKYGRVFKRNYLLYSAPGTGKSSLISMLAQDLINNYDGIVFFLSESQDIENMPDAMTRIRNIEPDRKVICVIEDIDSFTNHSYHLNTLLLNILDGNIKFDNLVIIATTNHIEDLEERYCNRPSRFDKVIEFPLPDDESRRVFISKTVLPEDLKKINLNEWVRKTKGYTIDHINELILLHFIYGETEHEAFKQMDTMIKNNNKLKNKSSVNKKKIGFGRGDVVEEEPTETPLCRDDGDEGACYDDREEMEKCDGAILTGTNGGC